MTVWWSISEPAPWTQCPGAIGRERMKDNQVPLKGTAMELLEIYADAADETHFRSAAVPFESRSFAPPSLPIGIDVPCFSK